MKRILLAGATLLALTAAQPTLAADAPVYKGPAPAAVALFNWSGLYIGGTVGAHWGDNHYFNPGGPFTSETYNVSGTIAGVTVGFNWQAPGSSLVLGVEGDWSWSSAKVTYTTGCVPPCTENWPWIATIRGRLGWAADRILFFVTGGAAFSEINGTQPGFGSTGQKNINGWTIGGGVEWAVWDRLSVKVEYLYFDFGNPVIFNPIVATPITYFPREHVARVGANWRF